MLQITEVLEVSAEKVESYCEFDYLEKASWDSYKTG